MHHACMRFSLFHSDSDSVFTPVPSSITSSDAAVRFCCASVHGHIGASHYHCWTWAPAAVAQVSRHELPRTTTVNLDGAVRCGSEHRSKAQVAASSIKRTVADGAFYFRQRAEHHLLLSACSLLHHALMTTTTPAPPRARLKTDISSLLHGFSTRGRKSSCYGTPVLRTNHRTRLAGL